MLPADEEKSTPIIYILSTNKDKYNEIYTYLKAHINYYIDILILENLKCLNLHEIQAEENEIIIDKCETAIQNIIINNEKKLLPNYTSRNSCILVEDSSFGIEEMNGLPGPYIRDFFLTLGNNKFYQMVKNYCISEIPKAVEKCNIAIRSHLQDEPLIFPGECQGVIVQPDNGEEDEYNWIFSFIPEGANKTYGRMTVDEKNLFSARRHALDKLCRYLNENKNYFNI